MLTPTIGGMLTPTIGGMLTPIVLRMLNLNQIKIFLGVGKKSARQVVGPILVHTFQTMKLKNFDECS